MNREQRRAQPNKTLVLKGIQVIFDDGTTTFLDIGKVEIVSRETGKALFKFEEKK